MNASRLPAVLAEAVGTLLFVFLGAGTVVVTGGLLSEGLTAARLLAIAIAHGLAITILVAATARISGGHLNPAVTFAAFLNRSITLTQGIGYVLAQLIGAAVGASLIQAVVPAGAAGMLGAHALGTGVSIGGGLLAEVILTFVLVLVVLSTAMDARGPGHLAPLAIGFAVLVDHLLGVPITGASMNPARSFGPALLAGAWANHWLYWLGPLAGALLAALFHRWLSRRPAL